MRLALLSTWVGVASAGTHYTCIDDEVAGELMGETGVVCAPKCASGSLECPTDVPDGTTAQPQCMLSDVDKQGYCGLLCQVDSQCPSGGVCWRAAATKAGLCVHPLSFQEWSRLAPKRKKLEASLPAAAATAGGAAKGVRLAKANEALLNLKQRFGIADGDADVLVVQEMIAAARAIDVGAGNSGAIAAFPQLPPATPATQLGYGVTPAAQTTPAASNAQQDSSVLGPWKKDISYALGNLESGVPGLQREIHDTVWNVEHIDKPGVASMLLRSALMVAMLYVGIGSAIKYQSMGARGIDMIPHLGFWLEYPRLVKDGIAYGQYLVLDMLGHDQRGTISGGITTFQPKSNSERDSFGNFEPSL